MYEYKCPGCGAVLKSAQPAPAGKQIKCKGCGTAFTPRAAAAAAPRPGTAAPVAKKKAAPVDAQQGISESPAAAAHRAADTDDANPYTVIKEEDTEEQKAAKKAISFDGVHGRGKRSARGPAMSLLVFPSNLLIAEGALTVLGGLAVFLWAMWPVV